MQNSLPSGSARVAHPVPGPYLPPNVYDSGFTVIVSGVELTELLAQYAQEAATKGLSPGSFSADTPESVTVDFADIADGVESGLVVNFNDATESVTVNFNDATETVTANFSATNRTITRTSGSWSHLYEAGDRIQIDGGLNDTGTNSLTITEVTDSAPLDSVNNRTILVLAATDTLVNQTGATVAVTLEGIGGTITRSSGSWGHLYEAGTKIAIANSVANDTGLGVLTVSAVTDSDPTDAVNNRTILVLAADDPVLDGASDAINLTVSGVGGTITRTTGSWGSQYTTGKRIRIDGTSSNATGTDVGDPSYTIAGITDANPSDGINQRTILVLSSSAALVDDAAETVDIALVNLNGTIKRSSGAWGTDYGMGTTIRVTGISPNATGSSAGSDWYRIVGVTDEDPSDDVSVEDGTEGDVTVDFSDGSEGVTVDFDDASDSVTVDFDDASDSVTVNFNDATETVTANFSATNRTITRTSGSWGFLYEVGTQIQIDGGLNDTGAGFFTIAAITDSTPLDSTDSRTILVLDPGDTVVDETGETVDVSVDGVGGTITLASGSWSKLRYSVGAQISIDGASANDTGTGFFTIAAITDSDPTDLVNNRTILVLAAGDSVVDETGEARRRHG